MSRRIELARSVTKDLRGIPKNDLARIRDAIDALATDPLPGGCKPYLTGIGGQKGWRIRVGTYRVLYTFDAQRVLIDRVAVRGEVYR